LNLHYNQQHMHQCVASEQVVFTSFD